MAVAGRGVEPGADGGGPQVDFQESVGGIPEDGLFFGQVVGECVEFVAEGHGDCVLELGAAHFEDVDEFVGFAVECVLQFVDSFDESLHAGVDAEPEAGGVGVVGRLGHVDVIVGVDDVVGPFGFA